MTVKRLKELLEDAPDDLPVYVMVSNEGGLFGFQEACEGESGEAEIDPLTQDDIFNPIPEPRKVFAILPHNFSEEDSSHEQDYTKN